MSAPMADPAVIAMYTTNLAANYCAVVAVVAVCYDFLITLRHEYEFIWHRKWSAATWLFLANRYTLLASVIEQAAPYSPQTYVLLFLDLLNVVPLLVLAVFSALRVFALLDRAYGLAAFTFFLGLVPVGVTIFQNSTAVYYYLNDPVLGSSCYPDPQLSSTVFFYCKDSPICVTVGLTYLTATLASVLAAIASDVVAIVTTWIKTYRHVREASSIGVNVAFGAILLQYGTVYFVVLCTVQVVNVLLLLIPSFQLVDPMSSILEVLPNIIISRFLIDLRQINAAQPSDTARFSRFSVPNFRVPSLPSIIGNMGEPLAEGETDNPDEQEDINNDSYEPPNPVQTSVEHQ
ncbi:hypothetical protein NM688_g8871 [Phlebia brevispora]|uniref:Uncharacterized protein n=1 Tax=Phlebia brevispora TaxID=194682 RepID=A0ACC1RM04_9APHY|nr:hypothetical protein NM688_g8871 [Phlebia brevispora]